MDDAGVLLLESAPERAAALARRIRTLGGYRPVAAKSAEQALRLVEDPRFDIRAVLLSPDFPFTDPERALRRLRQLCGTRPPRFIATGPRPSAGVLARLREAGVDLALWDPYDDARLRFQINRSLASPEQESVRRDQRAPTDWRARVRGAGREKEALVYSVSPGGAFLATPRPSMRGAKVSVELPLPAGNVTFEGRVLYTNVPGNLRRHELPIGMGVAFEALSADAERDLRFTVAQTLLTLVV